MNSATAGDLNPALTTHVNRSEAALRIAATIILAVAAAGIVAHFGVMLWTTHEFTQVESVVLLHSEALTEGKGLYYDLNNYPYTTCLYGPIPYFLWAFLLKVGAPLYIGGRLISFVALMVSLWLVWRALGLLAEHRYAVWTGVALVGCTANLLFWSTAGQTDMLACCFSLWAFVEFLEWRARRSGWHLVWAGLFVVLGVFTKQTMLAAGAAIALSLVLEDKRRGIQWISSVGLAGPTIALALNWVTGGQYFDNAIRANLYPFSAGKLWLQAFYLLPMCVPLLLIAIAGIRRGYGHLRPLYLYSVLAGSVWLLTASKIGSDLNYQIEFTLTLAMCAAMSLDTLDFFPSILERRRTWVTLLQLPLLVFIVMNVSLTARNLMVRVSLEPFKRAETEALRPYLVSGNGRVLSAHLGALVQLGVPMEVEPFSYDMLVNAGFTDPGPLRRDLAAGRFATVILYEDIFAPEPNWKNAETPTLPPVLLEEMRKSYRLVKHVPGPLLDGVYVYKPIGG